VNENKRLFYNQAIKLFNYFYKRKFMKKMLIGFLAILNVSVFAGETVFNCKSGKNNFKIEKELVNEGQDFTFFGYLGEDFIFYCNEEKLNKVVKYSCTASELVGNATLLVKAQKGLVSLGIQDDSKSTRNISSFSCR